MVKHLKKILSVTLAAAMFTAAVPAFAAPSSDNAAQRAAERLNASQKYFYNPSSGINLASENEYPETFDLRSADLDGSGVKKNYVTPVKNQGAFGTCWGFGATASAETSILTDLGLSYDEWNSRMPWEMDLSEHHLTWFSNMPLPEGDGDQGGEGMYATDPDISSGDRFNIGGFSQAATAAYSAGIGPAPEYMYPYRGKEGNIIYVNSDLESVYEPRDGYEPYAYSDLDDWSLDESERFGTVYPLEESFLLPSPAQFVYDEEEGKYTYVYNQAGTNAIKEQLMNGRPVTVAFASDSATSEDIGDYYYLNPATWAHYVPLSIDEDTTYGEATNHSVAIVGWDDSFPKENFLETPPGNGAWIVKNSWGSDESEFPNKFDWGDHGYFYLSYYDHTISYPEALDFDVSPDSTESGVYYSFKYDYMPVSATYRHNVFDESASMANKFQSEDVDVNVKTLTFYTDSPDTETTFEMYMLSSGSTSPTDGTLLASGTKKYPYGGYHRFDLEEPVYIPANSEFSVVVTNRTSDGKYEITNQEYTSELSARADAAAMGSARPYAKGVVNEGESYIKTTGESGGAEWADWSETVKADNAASEACFEKIDFMDYIEQTEAALDAYNEAADEYYAAHPEEYRDDEEVPEALQSEFNNWQTQAVMLRLYKLAIENGFTDIFPQLEDPDSFSNAALYARDNFPITVIADAVKRDHILYYDSATSKLYTKMDYVTKEFSEPIDSFPGAICEGNKLTLTSEFRFITTHEDGLYLSAGSTLYVPEGETPYIESAAGGFTRNDVSSSVSGIYAEGGCALDIDGTLTVIAGDGVNADSYGVVCEGNLKITGKGTLNVFGGNTSYDEAVQHDTIQYDSSGIYAYENIDISNAEVNAYGGDAYTFSYGIVNRRNCSLTISGGAQVKAEGGSSTDTKGYCAGVGCETGEIVINDNSSLTASSVGDKGVINIGLQIISDAVDDNGTKYRGRIKLENNSSLTIRAANSRAVGYGIYPFDGTFDDAIKAEMDDSCTFTVDTQSEAGFAELKGVTAMSEGNLATFDGEKGYYTDEDGNPVKNLSFYPKSAFNIAYENNAAAVTAPEGNYTVIFAAYDNGALADVKVENVNVGAERTTSVPMPEGFDTEGKTVKVMLWSSVDGMLPLCAADTADDVSAIQ